MTVSIVTISFNQIEYLQRCRSSILGQSRPVQHIIVDPGSTDGSRELIESWGSDVVAVLEKDHGPADGLNRGLSRITGNIWTYLNSDDELAPGAVQRLEEIHAQQPSTDVLIGNGWTIDELGRPIRFIRSDRFSPSRYSRSVGTVLQQATSFKSSSTIPGLRFNIENRFNWDTELLFDAYRAGLTFGYTPEVLGYFRMQPSSITVSGKFEDGLRAEREKLIKSVRGGRVLKLLSKPSRAIKALRRTGLLAPAFPGLAVQP